MRPECKQLATRRQRDICNGTADLPLQKINAYRERWGLQPLAADEVNPAVVDKQSLLVKSHSSGRKADKTTRATHPPIEDLRRVAYLMCPDRGEVVAEVTARSIGCDFCGAIRFYQCRRHNQLTTTRLSERERLRVLELGRVSGYGGLTCRNCYGATGDSKLVTGIAATIDSVLKIEDKVTVCVTTFKRPESLKRCIESLDRLYPSVPRIVQETDGNLSRGRNIAIAKTTTPYVMVCEDDFVFTDGNYLQTLCNVLDHDSEVGGASGAVFEVHKNRKRNWYANLRRFRGKLLHERPTEWKSTRSGINYAICDLLQNAGVWRKQVFESCPWDEQLEVQEHHEWFWRLRNKGEWRCAFVPSVSINHHHDRPNAEYNDMRGRKEFRKLAERKIGATFSGFGGFPVIATDKPNVIVLGIGHANTTITTRMLQALGWNLGDADGEYAESVSVREVDQQWTSGKGFDAMKARAALAKLPQPWAVKDPRFSHGVLTNWVPLLAGFQPVLLWVRKNLDIVLASHHRRGEQMSHEVLEKRERYCSEQFAAWPWGRLEITADRIDAAIRLWKPIRREPS